MSSQNFSYPAYLGPGHARSIARKRLDSHHGRSDEDLWPAPLNIRSRRIITDTSTDEVSAPQRDGSHRNRGFHIIDGMCYQPSPLRSTTSDVYGENQRTHNVSNISPTHRPSGSAPSRGLASGPDTRMQSRQTRADISRRPQHLHATENSSQTSRREFHAHPNSSIPSFCRLVARQIATMNRYGALPHGASDTNHFDGTRYEYPEHQIPIGERPLPHPSWRSSVDSVMSLGFVEADQLDDDVAPLLISRWHQFRRGHMVVQELRQCPRILASLFWQRGDLAELADRRDNVGLR